MKKNHKALQNLNTTDFFPSAIKEYNESYRFTIEVLQEQGVRLRYLKNKSVCGPSEICMNIREICVKLFHLPREAGRLASLNSLSVQNQKTVYFNISN